MVKRPFDPNIIYRDRQEEISRVEIRYDTKQSVKMEIEEISSINSENLKTGQKDVL